MRLFFFDIKNFLSVITIVKIVNSLKLLLSYYLSVVTKKPVIWGYPQSISVEPVNICNLHCTECPTGTNSLKRKKGEIDFELFEKIVADGKKYLYNIILYFQGEPFLSKKLFEQIKFAKKNNLYVSTSTNGHFLTKENSAKLITSGIDRIIVSLDGTDSKTYVKYRVGGDFEKVISGIKNLIEQRKILKANNPLIILQFLVFKHNQHQINEIKELAKKLNVDKLEIKTAQIINNSNFLTEIDRFSRYNISGSGLKIKSNLPNRCKRMWKSVVITIDGNISPCCFDKDSENNYGNYSEISFDRIRKSSAYIKFAKTILTNRKSIEICRNCTEGLKI